MSNQKRKRIVLETIVEEEESPGKRLCMSLVAPMTALTIACPAPSSKDQTLLEPMTALTISCPGPSSNNQVNHNKPSPCSKLNPDTKGAYCADPKPIICVVCGIPSDKLVVKPCGGHYVHGGEPCTVNLCMHCAMKVQRDLDSQLRLSEMHYCRPCSENFRTRGDGAGEYEYCHCGGGDHSVDILEQNDSEWLCAYCCGTADDGCIYAAWSNLQRLEADKRVFPRRFFSEESPENGLVRWIDTRFDIPWNRNACPGCGCHYSDLLESWVGTPFATRDRSIISLPTKMVVQCMICLREKQSCEVIRRSEYLV